MLEKEILKADIAMVEGFENAAIAVIQEDLQRFSVTYIYPFVWQNVITASVCLIFNSTLRYFQDLIKVKFCWQYF